jgi:5-methylcytosine-specific restriction enzyme B
VTRLHPILNAWVNQFASLPVPPAPPEDDPLSEVVERFLAERSYPTPKDHKALEYRTTFAERLSPEGLEGFDGETLKPIINGARYGNPGQQAVLNTTLRDASPEELKKIADTIHHLLWGDGPVAERIDALLDERKVKGLGESVIVKLLSIAHPERWLPVFPLEGEMGKEAFLQLLELPVPSKGTVGERNVEANDRLRERLQPLFPGDPHAMRQFLYWYLTEQHADETTSDVDLIVQAAEELHVSEQWLREIEDLLREKRQIIFYGPPGTGKTYVAQRLARALVGGDGNRVRMVQFHPSYAYEDFFEGYRPVLSDTGTMVFERKPGPLAQMAAQAEDAPGADHIMVIDEINRANLPKVFGELLYLLEYRDEPTFTQYRHDEPFTLPPQLYFIGTMNTADRSIALIDAALRRRFHFVPFFPHEGEIAGLLRRWLGNNGEPTWVADLVDAVNGELRRDLGGPHLQIGPSYFMVRGLDRQRVERIWQYSIHPYIEEQLFGQREQIEAYRFGAVMNRFEQAASGDGPPSASEEPGEGWDAGDRTESGGASRS